MNWFDVDRNGLAKLLEKRGKGFAILELIQNAWDTNTKTVDVTLTKIPGRPAASLRVVDQDPEGFKNLSHAFTLFAESEKKSDATKRGRFNLGEKLVLAVCEEATIQSTTGTITFDKDGRHKLRAKRETGSEFYAIIKMNQQEYDEACALIWTLLPPKDICTVFNGREIPTRLHRAEFTESLPTEIADAEGYLRKTTRNTTVRVYEPLKGETPMLYEMGIPVVETNDKWHVDVSQKIPLSLDRDNVTPSYLRTIRTATMNALFQHVRGEEASSAWAREAAADPNITKQAMEHVMTERFGEKRVIYDPSDPEANKIAVSQGYTVIAGNSLSKDEWSNVKQFDVALPAGKVTPSDKVLSGGSDKRIPEDKWTTGMRHVVRYSKYVAGELGISCSVEIVNDPFASFAACYGGSKLTYNVGRLGYEFFNNGITRRVNALLIHELGHHYSGDHLSKEYYDALCDIGARLMELAPKSEFKEVANGHTASRIP